MARNNLTLLNNSIVRYEAESGQVELSKDIVKQYICSNASDQEIYMFLQLCKYQRLNPFLREAYLVKYGNAPATMITGKETFLKRAETHPQFDGFEVNIELDPDNKKIPLTATAKVYRKDRKYPIIVTVDYDEYVQLKDGRPNKMWGSKPKTMLRKVALVQALREAFPTVFGGMYSPEEVGIEDDQLPTGYIDISAQPESKKNNNSKRVNWPSFWANVKEMGFDESDVHGIAGGIKGQPVDSIASWTREEVAKLFNKLKELHQANVEAQQQEAPPETPENNQETDFNPGEDELNFDEIDQGIKNLQNQQEPAF